jgi:hypothetical protein
LFFIEKIIIVCDADGPSGDWYKKFMWRMHGISERRWIK